MWVEKLLEIKVLCNLYGNIKRCNFIFQRTHNNCLLFVLIALLPITNRDTLVCFVQISDAKVIINDAKPGSKETLIIISGTPDQTHAAQSLIQAFVVIETEKS